MQNIHIYFKIVLFSHNRYNNFIVIYFFALRSLELNPLTLWPKAKYVITRCIYLLNIFTHQPISVLTLDTLYLSAQGRFLHLHGQ